MEYEGKEWDKVDLILYLRRKRWTYKQIGSLLGISKQWAYQMLANAGKTTGWREYPELEDPEFFENKSDDVIASELGIGIQRIARARVKLGLTKLYIPDVGKRREEFATFLTGHLPGQNFVSWMIEHLDNHDFTDKQKSLLIDFYLSGIGISNSNDINSDSDRVYRCLQKRKLKNLISKENIEDLILKGVLLK